MNSSIHRFSLDIQSSQSQISIPVMLGDTSRTFCITLSDGGNPYILTSECLAKITINRPTGTHLEDFCTIENNTTIVYHFSQNKNTAAVEGIHDCEIALLGVDGEKLTAARFTMLVSNTVSSTDDLEDEDLAIIDTIVASEFERREAEALRVEAEKERQKNIDDIAKIAANSANEEVARLVGELGVVQNPGNSENAVMSQKAVTEETRKTNRSITSVVPNLVDIAEGEPLYNRYFDTTTGKQIVNDDVVTTGFIHVESGREYKSTGFWWLTYFYDKDKNFLQGFDTFDSAMSALQKGIENVVYMRSTIEKNKLSLLSLRMVSTHFVQSDVFSKYSKPMESLVPNLVDLAEGKPLYDAYFAPTTGEQTSSANIVTTGFIPVESGKVYASKGFWWLTYFYDKDKNFLQGFDVFKTAMNALRNGIENVAYMRSTIETEKFPLLSLRMIEDPYHLTVGDGGDFESITKAIDFVNYDTKEKPVTIHVKAGVYSESVWLHGKYIILKGDGRNNTIVTYDSGDYDTPPLNVWMGAEVHDMSFIAKPNASGENGAYGVHIDMGWEHQDRVQKGFDVTRYEGVCLLENCYLASYNHPAIGSGTCPNSTIIIRNCELEDRGGSGSFGTLFIHNYLWSGTNQKAVVENCVIRNVGGYSPVFLQDVNNFDDRGTKDNFDTVFCFRNNILHNDANGLNAELGGTAPMETDCIAGYIKKDMSNFGNSMDALNVVNELNIPNGDEVSY